MCDEDGIRNCDHDCSSCDRLSDEWRAFLAGALAHLPGLCGLTAPSFNSYHRIVPQYWAGAFTCWGHDNREAPLRVPSVFWGSEEASTNLELKAADASCNPYLAIGGLIAAGLDGIDRGEEPPPPVEVDPATIPEEERGRRGILRLPATQEQARDALGRDRLLRATGTELLLVDDGFPPPGEGVEWRELGELAGCRALPVLRVETHPAGDVPTARERGYVALKTIAAYRGGLDRVSEHVVAALEANEQTGNPLPVQVHCGFGDSDLHLWRSDPSYLKPIVERFRETTFVLLHCYPFVREAGWMAHVYANVYFDLSLTIPHVSRPRAALEEALELAPVSKLLYASDAARTPELYLLAAKWWREALAEVLGEALPPDEAQAAGRAILRENALALYRLS